VWCLADAMLASTRCRCHNQRKFLILRPQDMSKLLELNNMWKSPGSSGHGQELASGVRESSYTENPDTHDDVRTRVGFVVATQVKQFVAVDSALVKSADVTARQAAADEMLARHGGDVPVAVLGEEPNERNIAQALRALQVPTIPNV
jgi:hypothetical protein